MIFITSWDDGHPFDLRLADMLIRWGIKGTFFIPIKNSEGLNVMTVQQIREIDKIHEIGSHTLNHTYLNNVNKANCISEVVEGKNRLENIVGHEINGFCYPGGAWNSHIRNVVIEAGFKYARTIENFHTKKFSDPFALPTTCQFYPHKKIILNWNFLKWGSYSLRYENSKILTKSKDWLENIINIIKINIEGDDVIHIWGHSWEVDKLNLWNELEFLFKELSYQNVRCMTIIEYIEYIELKNIFRKKNEYINHT